MLISVFADPFFRIPSDTICRSTRSSSGSHRLTTASRRSGPSDPEPLSASPNKGCTSLTWSMEAPCCRRSPRPRRWCNPMWWWVLIQLLNLSRVGSFRAGPCHRLWWSRPQVVWSATMKGPKWKHLQVGYSIPSSNFSIQGAQFHGSTAKFRLTITVLRAQQAPFFCNSCVGVECLVTWSTHAHKPKILANLWNTLALSTEFAPSVSADSLLP